MHIFDKTGKFTKSISLTHRIREFERTSEDNFLAQTSVVGKKNGKPVMLSKSPFLIQIAKYWKR